MSRMFDFGKIWEQEFAKDTGRFVRLVPTGKRLVLDLDRFNVTHLRGRTRSGKTSLVLIPWSYLFAQGATAFFIFDLSPEPSNLHHATQAAKVAGKTLKFVCLESGIASYQMAPFQAARNVNAEEAVQLGQLLTVATGGDHGIEHQYFTLQGASAFADAIIHHANSGELPTARSVANYLNDPQTQKRYPHAAEMSMSLQLLAGYHHFSADDGSRQVLIDECIENHDVVYFYISNLSAPLITRLAAGLSLATILHFARGRTNRGKKPNIRIHVDEYQSLVSRQMAAILQESCKYGDPLTYCLSHQSSSQLVTKEVDLRAGIFEASDLKIYLSSFQEDVEALQSLSKCNRVEKTKSLTHGGMLSSSVGHSEAHVPFISAEAIQEASAIFGMAIVTMNDGTGHTEPVFVKMEHRYEKLEHITLPRRQPSPPTPAKVDPGPGRRIPLDDPVRIARHAIVRRLIDTCVAEEAWRG
jgi:hypothetical protein